MPTAMKKLISLIIVAALVLLLQAEPSLNPQVQRSAPNQQTATEAAIGQRDDDSFRDGGQVQGSGVVSRVLSDDNTGNRHQRFILSLNSGRTLLIAHNIDLAPRIATLREGDMVEFYGQYEANQKGGVIHWTHHDPSGQHVDGWLKHNGRTYQ